MRLYLSSYEFGGAPEHLASLALPGPVGSRAAIVMNATDVYGGERRAEYVERNRVGLARIGFDAQELDLRDYFGGGCGASSSLGDDLDSCGLVWVVGGNSFVLRRAMAQSGFDAIATERVRAETLVYGGYSAGAVVAAPTLRGIDLVDHPAEVPAGYQPAPIWEGLGWLDYSIAPHYRSDHPESADIEKVVEYFRANSMPNRALRDGEAIVVNGTSTSLVIPAAKVE